MLTTPDPAHFRTGFAVASGDNKGKDPVLSQLGVTTDDLTCTDLDDKNKIAIGKIGHLASSFSEIPIGAKSEQDRVKLEEPTYDLVVPNQRSLRQIFDYVLLPTLLSVRKHKTEEAEEDYKKLKLLKDPKIKKNIAALLPKTLKDRLKPIGLDIQDQYFTVDQITRETMVTRLFMSSQYGGNMQETFPRPSKKFVDIHGMDDFMYLATEYQPEAPQLPGAPGLWLSTAAGEGMLGTFRVFVKAIFATGSKKSVYQYQGQYEVHAANPPALTVREWCDQPQRFHNKWAQAMVKMGWGARVCARILLRKELNREPKPLEVNDAILNGRYKVTTPEEVKEAYFQGKERMGVWTMKCVGYDNRFQKELHDTFPTWVLPPPKKLKPQGEARTTEKHKHRVFKHKRRSDAISDIPSESDSEEEVAKNEAPYSNHDQEPKPKRLKVDLDVIELSDDEEPVAHKASGTQSCPILL